MNKRKIWIDLTDIEKWHGQHGGTQRVVYGIALQYYKAAQESKKNIGFFVFDERSGKFFESSLDPIIERVKTATKSTKAKVDNISATRKQRLQHYVVEYTPQFIRSNDTVRRALFKVGKITYIQMNNARKRLRRRSTIIAARGAEILFNKDDTVLLLGKPWDIPVFSEHISKLKERLGFRLGVVVYDLVIPLYPHLHTPQLFEQYTRYAFSLAQSADILFPISKSSEKDLQIFCKKLSIPKPRTSVIRLGDELEQVYLAERPIYVNESDEFLLCVGTIEVRKNHTLLYYAYKLAQERNIVLPKLVIVGRPGWLADDVYRLFKKDKSLNEKVIIIEDATDQNLAWLYQNCLLTVYPSMYEGWGLPVAESLQYGKYCIASDASSVPEIAGNLLEYFSPYSVDELLNEIVKYTKNPKNLSVAEERIKSAYKTTSWHETYIQIDKAINY